MGVEFSVSHFLFFPGIGLSSNTNHQFFFLFFVRFLLSCLSSRPLRGRATRLLGPFPSEISVFLWCYWGIGRTDLLNLKFAFFRLHAIVIVQPSLSFFFFFFILTFQSSTPFEIFCPLILGFRVKLSMIDWFSSMAL